MQKLFAILLIAFCFIPVSRAQDNSLKSDSVYLSQPQFLDLNGDGLNDLAPDADHDGIPDQIDPDFYKFSPKEGQDKSNLNGGLWTWFRSMPDSISNDSTSFKEWWSVHENQMNWRVAWQRWQFIQEHEARADLRQRMLDRGFNPRNGRFINTPSPRGRGGRGGEDEGEGGRGRGRGGRGGGPQ